MVKTINKKNTTNSSCVAQKGQAVASSCKLPLVQ